MDKKPIWAPDNTKKDVPVPVKEVSIKSLWDIHKTEVLERFRKLSQKKELKKAKKQERINLMKELRGKGFTLQEIGDEFGLTRERVRQLIK